MQSTQIDPQRFWDLYFRNEFLTLERDRFGYRGTTFFPKLAAPPEGLLTRDADRVFVEISSSALREYDYLGDGRFALISRVPSNLRQAYEKVIQKSYPYRDPAPFGKNRMAELFIEIRSKWGLDTSGLSLALFEQVLLSMVEGHNEALNQPLAALAWFLGERRERSSAGALLSIVHNASFVPIVGHRIHFTTVDAALTALWKVNDKSSLSDLLELMRRATGAGRQKLAPLFERLLSTGKLLSLEECGEDYYRPEFWSHMLSAHLGFGTSDWDRYDVRSLFWEIRYLSGLRLPESELTARGTLADDEVRTVRESVQRI